MIEQTVTRLHRTSQSSLVALASSVSEKELRHGINGVFGEVRQKGNGKIQLGFIIFFRLEIVEATLAPK